MLCPLLSTDPSPCSLWCSLLSADPSPCSLWCSPCSLWCSLLSADPSPCSVWCSLLSADPSSSSLWCSHLSADPPRPHYGPLLSADPSPCSLWCSLLSADPLCPHCGAPSSVLTLPVLTACLPCSHGLPVAVAGSLRMQTGAAGTASGCPASCADWVCAMLAGMRTGAAGTALGQGTPSLVAGGSHKSSCGRCPGPALKTAMRLRLLGSAYVFPPRLPLQS